MRGLSPSDNPPNPGKEKQAMSTVTLEQVQAHFRSCSRNWGPDKKLRLWIGASPSPV